MRPRQALTLVTEETPHTTHPQIVYKQTALEPLARRLFAEQFEAIWGFPLHVACNPEEAHHITYEYVEGDALRQVTLITQNADEAPEVITLPLMYLQDLADTTCLRRVVVEEEKR